MKGKLRLPLLAAALAGITLGVSVPAASAADGAVMEKGKFNPTQQSAATIAARQKWFGLDNVNPKTGAVRNDVMIMSYAGISTFAASFMGHVILLDGALAYGPSGTWGSSAGYISTTAEEYATLNPEMYLFGHGHADHMGNTPQILAVLPTLQMYGMEEHCNDIKSIMAPKPVNCTSILHAGAQFGEQAILPGGTSGFISGLDVRAVKHPHSAGTKDKVNDPAFDTEQVTPHDCVSYDTFPPEGTEPREVGGPTSGVLSFSWQFHVRGTNFSLGWADTTGDISGNLPVNGLGTGAEVYPVYQTWPHTTVLFGAIAVSPRRVMNQQLSAIQPQLFVPIHHDPCAFDVYREFTDQMATVTSSNGCVAGGTCVLPGPMTFTPSYYFLTDPGDYHKPTVFDPTAKYWD